MDCTSACRCVGAYFSPQIHWIFALNIAYRINRFYRIVFSRKSEELDSWMETAAELKIDELDRYINGLQNDLRAVKNAIIYPYNNGLAEGSVNKIKLTKRIMYGRNSFALLKAKLLINEYFHQIN